MRALYIDHGSPMNAVETNSLTETLQNIGKDLTHKNIQRVIVFSAHFLRSDTIVEIGSEPFPHMVYDMMGFPDALYQVEYPVKTDIAGGEHLAKVLEEKRIQYVYNKHRGIDHGMWSILLHLFPQANVPIILISTSMSGGETFAYELGQILADTYDDTTLLITSGTIVHNLRMLDFHRKEPFSWAKEFDAHVHQYLQQGNFSALQHPHDIPGGVFSVPTRDHYLPLVTFAGASIHHHIQSLHEGFAGGNISERIYTNFSK